MTKELERTEKATNGMESVTISLLAMVRTAVMVKLRSLFAGISRLQVHIAEEHLETGPMKME